MNDSGNKQLEFTDEDYEVADDLSGLEHFEPVHESPTFRSITADIEALATYLGMEGVL